jgi:hypothetical protein
VQRPLEPHEGQHVAPLGHVTEQSTQSAPAVPHAASAVPGWHLVSLQQPPLHARPPAQLTLQTPASVLHACPEGQSLGPWQPASPPVVAPASSAGSSPKAAANREPDAHHGGERSERADAGHY